MAECRLCNPRPMESIDPITVEALIPRCHYDSCTQEVSEGFAFFAAEFSGRTLRMNNLAPLQGSRFPRILDFLHAVIQSSVSYMDLEDERLLEQYGVIIL